MEALLTYLPIDRALSLARGESLPDRTVGTALFVDISGFTPLTEALARDLGPQRGAEELTHHLNLVYDALIAELYRFGGSVIGFSGDAITCWFEADLGHRAAACALLMQSAAQSFASVTIPSGRNVSLAIKAGVATAPARRFVVGDPSIQLIDVLAGAVLDDLAAAERHAEKGDVLLDSTTMTHLAGQVRVAGWRGDHASGRRYAMLERLEVAVEPAPWPPLPIGVLSDEVVRPWLLPAVYQRLRSGQGEFLAELRPGVAVFVRFSGIDYSQEDAGSRLDAFVQGVQHIAGQYEGILAQLIIGDKGSYMFIAFGAPVAHEDDVLRAGSAALEVRDFGRTLGFIRELSTGISAGRMRTGAYGGALRRTYGLLGDDVNLAARLMTLAGPGQILVSQAAQQSASDAFEWHPLPPVTVRGKAEPIQVFALEGINLRPAARLAQRHARLPLVGRDDEVGLARRCLEQTRQGQGQVVTIQGDAGLGKSRLIVEIIGLAQSEGMSVHSGECLSYGTNISYLVWQSIWHGLFGLDPVAEPAERVAALEQELGRIAPALLARLPLLGVLLNLPIADTDLTRSFDAKLRKTSLESMLVDCLRALAAERPLVLALDSCQWLDPLSHDLLQVLMRAITASPVLIVLGYRPPEPDGPDVPRLDSVPYLTGVEVGELLASDAARLLRLNAVQLFGPGIELLPGLVERLLMRAGGNPFYIEELLSYLHHQGISPQDAQAVEHLELPASLHSLILARVDGLTESQKATLRVASIVGRQFEAAMLWNAFPQVVRQAQVTEDLDSIVQHDLIVPAASAPEPAYLFRQIVTHQVTYESMPHATRAILHEQSGEYLERIHSDALQQLVDILAYHFSRGENLAKKREYLLKAGAHAQANYANAAAIDYYQRVLPLLPQDEQAPVRLQLGQVMELVGRWPEARELYAEAMQLAERAEDRTDQARCQLAMADLARKRGDYAEANEWLQHARALFEELKDEAGVGQVLHLAGTLAAQQGDYAAAQDFYEQSLDIRLNLGDRTNIANLLNNQAIVARFRGNDEEARLLNEMSLGVRRELGDRRAIAVSLNNLGNVALDQGDLEEARASIEEAVLIQRQVGDRAYLANSLNNLGNVIRTQADYVTAHALYRESLAINHELGERRALAYVLEDIGVLAAAQGMPVHALRLAGAASQLREVIGAPLSPREAQKLERGLAPAREALEPAEQEREWQAGLEMILEEAIAYAQLEDAAQGPLLRAW
jgi:adenylate cyclase